MASKMLIIIASLALILMKASAVPSYSWTAWISDEDGDGQNCMVNQTVAAARCSGRYCDNMQLGCLPLPANTWLVYISGLNPPYWTRYISEESKPPSVECDWNTNGLINGMVIGLKATGDYSDNISIHCVRLGAGKLTDCKWTAYFSEEAGELDFPNGYYATGVQCSGRYCDNISFRICKVLP